MLNLVANGPSGYTLSNSLRFRSSASAYLSRTPSVAGNRTTWTWSLWVKRSNIGQQGHLFAANTSSIPNLQDTFEFEANDTLQYYSVLQGTAVNAQLATTQVFRDPSAWYHIVLAVDTTQATAANRLKLYINGSQVTAFSTATYPSLNYVTGMNAVVPNVIGKPNVGTYFDGYMTEVNFIDGQALTPSSFGSTNATTGVWQPAKYTGTYGTNGFYLNFNSIALTSGSNTGLGKDNSGNGNYWNTNNISVTAGTTYDAMTDVPTLTSATVANYAVMNPIELYGVGTLTDGNLKYTSPLTQTVALRSAISITSGKYYWEVTCISAASNTYMIGLSDTTIIATNASWTTANAWAYYGNNGQKYTNATGASYGATYTANDVIGVAFDADVGTLTFYKNNTSQGTAYTGLTGKQLAPYLGNAGQAATYVINFGQQPFTYTPPTGFVALNTFNLPSSTIPQGNKYMDATLYTGTGATISVTNAAGFKPDFVWLKGRSIAYEHGLFDSVRGVTKYLTSNATTAEATITDTLTAFNSNGFTYGANVTQNNNGSTFVGWQWQAGQGSTSSNTSGSITSTVSVNATAGFSIVTYTGTSTAGTIGHGLGVAPKMIIVKPRSATGDWIVYTSTTGAGNFLLLDTIAASAASTTKWNNTAPTSSVFSVGIDTTTNFLTTTYVAYCWAEIAGFSKFGSYTGNGSTDGTFVYTGFRPKFIMVKSSSAAEQWDINDTSRDVYNGAQYYLTPNSSAAEGSVNPTMDILSNGFKLKYSAAPWNTSGATYIYAAFAENPFKNALAR